MQCLHQLNVLILVFVAFFFGAGWREGAFPSLPPSLRSGAGRGVPPLGWGGGARNGVSKSCEIEDLTPPELPVCTDSSGMKSKYGRMKYELKISLWGLRGIEKVRRRQIF